MPPTESANRILAEHYRYLTDTVRIEAFRKALAGAVTPSDVVLDLGCGTGVLGFLAVEAGARTVIGIEQSGLIQVARSTASRLGLGSRTHYVRGHSTAVSVSPKATLLVCDQLDPLGFEAGLLESVVDARRRLLTLDATFVPASFETWIAPAEAHQTYEGIARWDATLCGVRFEELRTAATNSVHPVRENPRLLAPSQAAWCFTLDSVETVGALHRTLEWPVTQAGILHGLLGFFRAQLGPDVEMTNDPGASVRINRSAALLPLAAPVEVRRGDRVVAALLAKPGLVTQWSVRVVRNNQTVSTQSQSTLQGRILSTEDLHPRASG